MNAPLDPGAQEERTRTALAAAHEDAKFPDVAANAILARANEVAAQRRGARTWRMPMALAAAFVLGVLATSLFVAYLPGQSADDGDPLTLPGARVTRDQSPPAEPVPVENADPQDWYRYIQELVFAGQLEEAEKHLKRFNELHPGFVPKSD
jgi:hypothetical protein